MTQPKRPASRRARAGARPSGAEPRRDKQRPRAGRPVAPVRSGWRERPLPLLAGLAAIVVVAAVLIFGGRPGATAARPAPSGCPTSEPAPLAAGQTRTVTIETAKGSIVIKVDGRLAPIATGNFVALAGCGFYDGVVFHRAASLPDGTPFVIQGGDRENGNGTGGPGYTIADEPVTTNYRRGTVAMARTSQPHSEGSQFFVVLSDLAAASLQSANNYAILGEVNSGMDVADAIFGAADKESPTNPIPMTHVGVTSP